MKAIDVYNYIRENRHKKNTCMEMIEEFAIFHRTTCDGSNWKTCGLFNPLEWGCECCSKYDHLKI